MGNGAKIVFFSLIVCLASLFFPWISLGDGISIDEQSRISVYSSSSLLGYVGILHGIGIIIALFFLFSRQKTEKIRYLLGFSLSQSRIIAAIASGMMILTLHTFFSIGGLKYFSADLSYSRAIILSLTGNILLLIGVYFLRKENRKIYKATYIKEEKESHNHKETLDEKRDNMKLPF